MEPQVLLEVRNSIAYLTLNRSAANNSLTPEFLHEITSLFEQIGQNPDCKVVLLSANSHFFSIGGDMNYFKYHQANLKPAAEDIVSALNQMIMAMIRLPVPVVAAVHSIITGGSLGFLAASDLAIGCHNTRLKAHYASAGFSPDGGWATLLPLLGNQRKAAEFLMLNTSCSAEEAERLGLINHLVDPEEVFATAERWAEHIVEAPRGTIRNTKRLLWGDLEQIESLLQAEYLGFIELIQTAEARQGIDEFLSHFSGYHSIEDSQLSEYNLIFS